MPLIGARVRNRPGIATGWAIAIVKIAGQMQATGAPEKVLSIEALASKVRKNAPAPRNTARRNGLHPKFAVLM
jgi:hypothetical protein